MQYLDPRTGEIYQSRPTGFLKSGLHSKYLKPFEEKKIERVVKTHKEVSKKVKSSKEDISTQINEEDLSTIND